MKLKPEASHNIPPEKKAIISYRFTVPQKR